MIVGPTAAFLPKGPGVLKAAVPVSIGTGVLQPWRVPPSACNSLHPHHSTATVTDLNVQTGHGAVIDPTRLWGSKHYPRPLVQLGVEHAPMGGELLQVVVASQGNALLVLLVERGLGLVVLPL